MPRIARPLLLLACLMGGACTPASPVPDPDRFPLVEAKNIPPAPRMTDPQGSGDILQKLAQSPAHAQFVALLHRSGTEESLLGPGPLTVLAPTNQAIRSLPAGALAALVQPSQGPALQNYLKRYILPGRALPQELSRLAASYGGRVQIKTKGQPDLVLAQQGDNWLTGPSTSLRIVGAIPATNGNILIVDGALPLP